MIRRHTLVFSTLTTMARQRLGLEGKHCATVLELLDAGAAVDAALHQRLKQSGLSDLEFGILLALFTLEPSPVCPADLASYTGFTRPSVTDALSELRAHDFVTVERSQPDRRSVDVRLTDAGRHAVEAAATRYLDALNQITRALAAGSAALARVCTSLTEGASRLSA